MFKIIKPLLLAALILKGGGMQAQLFEKLAKQKQQKEVEAEVTKATAEAPAIAEKIKDEGMTCDIHKANVAQILFSDQPITRDVMNDKAVYRSKFTYGSNIYGRAFLAKGINKYLITGKVNKVMQYGKPDVDLGGKEYTKINDKFVGDYISYPNEIKSYYTVKVYFNNTEVFMKEFLLENREEETGLALTTLRIPMIPKDGEDLPIDPKLASAYNNLAVGNTTIKVELYAGRWTSEEKNISAEPIATGNLQVEKKEGAASFGTGKSFKNVERGMEDPALEARFLKDMQRAAKEKGWSETPLAVKITNTGFTVEKNEFGYPIKRGVRTYILFKKKSTGKCFMSYWDFFEDYQGGGYAGNYVGTDVGKPKVDCDCDF